MSHKSAKADRRALRALTGAGLTLSLIQRLHAQEDTTGPSEERIRRALVAELNEFGRSGLPGADRASRASRNTSGRTNAELAGSVHADLEALEEAAAGQWRDAVPEHRRGSPLAHMWTMARANENFTPRATLSEEDTRAVSHLVAALRSGRRRVYP